MPILSMKESGTRRQVGVDRVNMWRFATGGVLRLRYGGATLRGRRG